jgi:hypothetical protein
MTETDRVALAEDGLTRPHTLRPARGANRSELIRWQFGERGNRRQEGFRGHGRRLSRPGRCALPASACSAKPCSSRRSAPRWSWHDTAPH